MGFQQLFHRLGGILEVIEVGNTGYSVDCRNRNKLNYTLKKMLSDIQLYKAFSLAAKERLSLFGESALIEKSHSILQGRVISSENAIVRD